MTAFERSAGDPRDRFFHSMVVMGSALALGCSGVSVHDASPGSEEDGVEATAGRGGSGGAPTGTAGSGGTATAGTGSAGISGSGGTATSQCPDEQYTCTGFTCYDDVWTEGGRCYCDPSLPVSPADCNAGTTFVCRPTLTDRRTGAALPEPARLDCRCVPAAESCSDTCRATDPDYADGYRCTEPVRGEILCGCSFIYLR
jgi:hypothetical protein